MLAPHTDRDKAKADLTTTLSASVINDIHVDGDDYSILQLQPPAGKAEATLNMILSMEQQHPEYKAACKNFLIQENGRATNDIVTNTGAATAPDDPDFPLQWYLSNMNWTRAWRQFRSLQKQPARVTILGSYPDEIMGYNTDELGPDIVIYNCLTGGCPEVSRQTFPVAGSPEGNLDSSLIGSLTNNGELIAGAACFTPNYPCLIKIVQVSEIGTTDSTSFASIITGLTWAINHQRERGGPGPVSSSHNNHSDPCGSQAYQDDFIMQMLAGSLRKQGDILVESAGDCPCLNTTTPAGNNIVLVQGTDMQNKYDTAQLTRVQNDPFAAPGACLPSIRLNKAQTQTVIQYNVGSSNSAPLWSSAIAIVQAFNPGLNAVQANDIVYHTGTPVVGSPWHAVIPNFYAAIHAALAH
jgi:hypothetical protein